MIDNLIKYSRVNISELEQIKQFIGSKDNPKFFITLTEINKIGINPRSGYNTPLGLYCYPLTEEIYNQLISSSLPFAGNQHFVNVFTLSSPIYNLEKYTESDLNKDLNTIKLMYNPASDSLNYYINAAKECKNPFASGMWNVTRHLSNSSILKWSSIFRNLGYLGFYDPGMGLIHPSEPTQAVILDPSIIIPVQTFINPHGSVRSSTDKISKEDFNIISQKRKYYGSRLKNLSHNNLIQIARETNSSNDLLQLLNSYNKNLDSQVLLEILNRLNEAFVSQSDKINFIIKIYKINSDMLDIISNKFIEIVEQSKNLDNVTTEIIEIISTPIANEDVLKVIIDKIDRPSMLLMIIDSPKANENILQLCREKLKKIINNTDDVLTLQELINNSSSYNFADQETFQLIFYKIKSKNIKDLKLLSNLSNLVNDDTFKLICHEIKDYVINNDFIDKSSLIEALKSRVSADPDICELLFSKMDMNDYYFYDYIKNIILKNKNINEAFLIKIINLTKKDTPMIIRDLLLSGRKFSDQFLEEIIEKENLSVLLAIDSSSNGSDVAQKKYEKIKQNIQNIPTDDYYNLLTALRDIKNYSRIDNNFEKELIKIIFNKVNILNVDTFGGTGLDVLVYIGRNWSENKSLIQEISFKIQKNIDEFPYDSFFFTMLGMELSPELLEKIINKKEDNPETLSFIVKNPGANQNTLNHVNLKLKKILDNLGELKDTYMARDLAGLDIISQDFLQEFVNKIDVSSVLQVAASNPIANENIFKTIIGKTEGKNSFRYICEAIVHNPSVTENILKIIMEKTDIANIKEDAQYHIYRIEREKSLKSAKLTVQLINKRAAKFENLGKRSLNRLPTFLLRRRIG